MKRYPLILFFVLAYLFSWIVWFGNLAQLRGLVGFHIPGAFAFIGLSLAAVIAALATAGMAGFRDLISRWVRWKVEPVWYGVAFFFTALLGLIAILIGAAVGLGAGIGKDATAAAALGYFAFQLPLFLVTEESAWRGFALPRLQLQYSALTSSLILGLLWGLWHMPLFLTPETFQSQLPFVGFLLSAVATSIMHTWLFNNTRGSVLLAAIFHAATDASILYLGVMTGGGVHFWIFVMVQWIAVAVIIWRTGAQHLTRKTDLRGTSYTA